MATQISGRVPARILRRVEGSDDYQPLLELMAERFMGVLKHPVPRREMLHKFGLDERGCKVVAEWCDGSPEEHPIRAGDLLEIEEKRHEVLGVIDRPGCYFDLYIQDS